MATKASINPDPEKDMGAAKKPRGDWKASLMRAPANSCSSNCSEHPPTRSERMPAFPKFRPVFFGQLQSILLGESIRPESLAVTARAASVAFVLRGLTEAGSSRLVSKSVEFRISSAFRRNMTAFDVFRHTESDGDASLGGVR